MQIKLYLNENLSHTLAQNLRIRGYDVVSSHETGMDGVDDQAQFKFAVSQQRAVVTNNFSDFIALHEQYSEAAKKHFGIIFTTQDPIHIIQQRLLSFLQKLHQEEIINQVRWLNEFK